MTEDGGIVLRQAGVELENGAPWFGFIEESDDLGLWLRETQEGEKQFILLFWHYILSVDVESGLGKIEGLKG